MGNCKQRDYFRVSDRKLDVTRRMNISDYQCPKNRTFNVRGNNIDEEFTYMQIAFTRCDTSVRGNDCQSDKEITALVNQLEVQFVFSNANFDQKDLYDPVK